MFVMIPPWASLRMRLPYEICGERLTESILALAYQAPASEMSETIQRVFIYMIESIFKKIF